MGNTIIAITSDWHVNDTTALCPPRFYRERDSSHSPDKYQRAIYRAWVEYWELVAQRKAALKAQVVGVFLGDLGDLNRHSKAQLISPYEPDVKRAMIAVVQPALAVTDYNIVIRGTEAHTGGLGALEEWFADDIGAVKDPDGQASWWVWRAEIDGVRIHATHHPPTATRIVSKRSQAVSRMCERLASEYDLYGWREKPHLAFWAHVHWCAPGHEMGIDGWTTGSWKGLGSFGHRIGVTMPSPVTGLIVTISNGAAEVDVFERQPPRVGGKLWKLP